MSWLSSALSVASFYTARKNRREDIRRAVSWRQQDLDRAARLEAKADAQARDAFIKPRMFAREQRFPKYFLENRDSFQKLYEWEYEHSFRSKENEKTS